MVFNDENLFKEIILKLCIVQLYIVNVSKCKLYDANVIAEDFFASLFSIIYDTEFKNLNKSAPNAKAVDIGDIKGELAIQITAEKTAKKVRDSVNKFKTSNFHSQYKKFKVFIINSGNVPSNNDCEVGNITTLLEEIKFLDDNKKNKINNFLRDNLNIPIFNNNNEELIKNHLKRPNTLNAYFKTNKLELTDGERKKILSEMNKYINILDKIKSVELRSFLRLCAERIYQLNLKEPDITLSQLIEALPQNFKNKHKKLIKDLEKYGLLSCEYDQNQDHTIVHLISFGECNDFNITCELISFAEKNKLNPKVFFDKLDFSPLDQLKEDDSY